MADGNIGIVPVAPSLLGESPMWHPTERCLYWCDIHGHRLNRYDPASGRHDTWSFDTDIACCAPLLGGELLLALRSGLVRFDPVSGKRRVCAKAPYDPAVERFNDGKADPQGRLWIGTIYEPRDRPAAALYRWADGELTREAEGVTVGNGLAWSPDGRTAYWSDTKAHTIHAFDFDPVEGTLSGRRVWAEFPAKQPGAGLDGYGGRPDGAAVDTEGCYWVAMFEGARVLRLSPRGELLHEVRLPVQCPTMPCFGGPDLKTLYVTTARDGRPADELARQPWAGQVLTLRVDVPGLPVNFAQA
ncbi:SMP-30/gluconolactonase/LRE family protein [Aquincola sp. MAHUQ-54]|uniref:SMP-30/gluconolactonase/LRE family protein n=1 Tax=Aquincola agrisoli TaxID=3119538 RepID=A0AAW9QAJ2_9BURK